MIDQTFLKENLLAYGLPCPDGLTEKLDRTPDCWSNGTKR